MSREFWSSPFWWWLAALIFAIGMVGIHYLQRKQWRTDLAGIHPIRIEAGPDLLAATDLPRVSVVVAAWNEGPTIVPFLESYARLRYVARELILCIGGEDLGYELARQWPGEGVTILRQEAGDTKLKAIQRCLPYATGDVIYLTDADCRLDNAGFERLLAPIAGGSETITTGLFRPLDEERLHPFVRQQWATLIYQRLVHGSTHVANYSGHNAMIRSDALHILRAASAVTVGEDVFSSFQATAAGYRIRSVKDSMIQTEVPQNLAAYVRRQSRWVRSLLQFAIQFRKWRMVASLLLAAAIGVTMLLTPLLAAAFGPLILVLCGLGWLGAASSRRRHFRVLNACMGEATRLQPGTLVQLMVADFFVWATAPLVLLVPRLRDSW